MSGNRWYQERRRRLIRVRRLVRDGNWEFRVRAGVVFNRWSGSVALYDPIGLRHRDVLRHRKRWLPAYRTRRARVLEGKEAVRA